MDTFSLDTDGDLTRDPAGTLDLNDAISILTQRFIGQVEMEAFKFVDDVVYVVKGPNNARQLR